MIVEAEGKEYITIRLKKGALNTCKGSLACL